MAKGTNEGVSEEEGQSFLQKAQELMMRYNIEIAELVNSGKFFVRRPITPITNRWHDHYYTLGALLAQYYNVQYIHYFQGNAHFLELFGEPANIDVAEYIAHILLQQGERLYQEFLEAHKLQRKENKEKYGHACMRKASKVVFMKGLIDGYRTKLDAQREHLQATFKAEHVAAGVGATTASKGFNGLNGLNGTEILLANSKILRDSYEREYNPTTRTSYASNRGAGYQEGNNAGANLSINQGINGGSTGKFLSA